MGPVAACAIAVCAAATVHDASTRLVSPKPPSNLGRGPANLVFLSPRVGFAATTGGAHFVPRVGWLWPGGPGRIQRTDDGGRTWRTVWKGRRVVFESMAATGRTIVATGGGVRSTFRTYDCPYGRDQPCGARVVVASTDGGRTWHRRPPPSGWPASIQPVTARTWFAAIPQDTYDPYIASLVRTDDAGGHWRRIALPPNATVVRFATSRIGLAGVSKATCRHGFARLWRTVDGGLTWRPVAGTCGTRYTDINVVSPRVLVTAESDQNYRARFHTSIVRRSTDGGRTWTTIVRSHTRWQVERVAFGGERRGFLISDGAFNRGYEVRTRLQATSDGGRTWQVHALPWSLSPATGLSVLGPEVPQTFLSGRFAWVGSDGESAIWRTTDAGRTWRMTGGPLQPTALWLSPSGALRARTDAGPMASIDDGRTWRPARAGWSSDHLGVNAAVSWRFPAAALVTGDAGRNWRRVHVPTRDYEPSIAFKSGSAGLYASGSRAWATHNGGRSWRRLRRPRIRHPLATVGSGVVAVVGTGAVLVSTSEGALWHVLRAKHLHRCTVARPGRADIWLVCARWQPRHPLTVMLTSNDCGRSWTRRTSRLSFQTVVALSGREAWGRVADDDNLSYRNGKARRWLVHTTDGGATWRRESIVIRPGSRAVQTTRG